MVMKKNVLNYCVIIPLCLFLGPLIEISSRALYTLCCACEVHADDVIPTNKLGLKHLRLGSLRLTENKTNNIKYAL